MELLIGTSGYGYKEWKGKFYPERISPKEMLHFYSERFNTVEINNTFYRMPTAGVLASWAEQVPESFVFTFKAPQVITHLKRLKNVGEEAEYLFRTLSILAGKLGAVLFQFPKSFRVDRPALETFLDLLPADTPCAFDFRSPTWFSAEILDLLRERGCALCNEDRDEYPLQEITSSANWGYLRLRRTDYQDDDLSQWRDRIFSQKWERVFIFFKHEEEARGPQLAMGFHQLAYSKAKKIKT